MLILQLKTRILPEKLTNDIFTTQLNSEITFKDVLDLLEKDTVNFTLLPYFMNYIKLLHGKIRERGLVQDDLKIVFIEISDYDRKSKKLDFTYVKGLENRIAYTNDLGYICVAAKIDGF